MESRFRSPQHLDRIPIWGWSYPEAKIVTWMSYDTESQKILLKNLLKNVCKTKIKSIPKVKGQKPVFRFIKVFGRTCSPMNSFTDTNGKPKSRNLSVSCYDMKIREKARQMEQFIGKILRPKLNFKFRSDGGSNFIDRDWINFIWKGSNKTRFQYCQNSWFQYLEGITSIFTVQGVNIHRHNVWRGRFSEFLCAWCFPRLSSAQVIIEQLSHMAQLRCFSRTCTCRYVRTSFRDQEINTATSTSSCSGALEVLLHSTITFSQSFVRCKNCSFRSEIPSKNHSVTPNPLISFSAETIHAVVSTLPGHCGQALLERLPVLVSHTDEWEGYTSVVRKSAPMRHLFDPTWSP